MKCHTSGTMITQNAPKLNQIVGFYCSLTDRPLKAVINKNLEDATTMIRRQTSKLLGKYQNWLKDQDYLPA